MALMIIVVLLALVIMWVFQISHYLNALHCLCVRLTMDVAFLAAFYYIGKFSHASVGRISFHRVVIKDSSL